MRIELVFIFNVVFRRSCDVFGLENSRNRSLWDFFLSGMHPELMFVKVSSVDALLMLGFIPIWFVIVVM